MQAEGQSGAFRISPGISGGKLPVPRSPSSGQTVAFREIFRASHFLEPANGALKLETSVARRIETGWLSVGRREQLHTMLVQFVDQGHEPRRFVAHLARHDGNSDYDDGVEALGDCQIVRGAASLSAQPLERKDGYALQALRDVKL